MSESKLKALFAFMVLCAVSVRSIPAYGFWGADLQNLHAYQRCTGLRNPYLIPGGVCGDLFSRGLYYPPFLFHAFFWLRPLELEAAMYVWSFVTLALLVIVYLLWSRMAEDVGGTARRSANVLFGGLLLIQYPTVFLLERGGTDMPPTLLWTLAAWLFRSRMWFLSGLLAGAAAAFKIYPAISAAIVGFALVFGSLRNLFTRTDWVRFGAGVAIGVVVLNALWFDEAHAFYRVTLPYVMKAFQGPAPFSHSLPSFAGAAHPLYAKYVLAFFFGLWCWSASRSLWERPGMTFAALLAMSTYFASVTYDYNLVTTYPLLLLLFVEAQRTGRWGLLAFGLVAILGDRELFAKEGLVFNPFTHLGLQFAWLTLCAIDLALHPKPPPDADPRSAGAESALVS